MDSCSFSPLFCWSAFRQGLTRCLTSTTEVVVRLVNVGVGAKPARDLAFRTTKLADRASVARSNVGCRLEVLIALPGPSNSPYRKMNINWL